MKKKRIIFAAGAVALLFAVTSTKPVDSQNYPKITVKSKWVNKYKDKIEDYESDNLTLKAETDFIKDKTEEAKGKAGQKAG